MSNEEDLLRAVLENPKDNIARRIFADCLEENEADETCRYCRGESDDGSCWHCVDGTASNGKARWAKFIRLHVDYACEKRKTYRKKMEREINLQLRGCVTMRTFGLVNDVLDILKLGMSIDGWKYCVVPIVPACRIERGFIQSVHLWWSHFESGLYKEFFVSHPITRVTFHDCSPLESADGSWMWVRETFFGSLNPASGILPEKLLDAIAKHPDAKMSPNDVFANFKTKQAAEAALSWASVNHGRQKAGLSPLEACSHDR